MTELAAGAVSSLLVVVRNEQQLLGGVKDDVQFIKEEMESMKSFLAHLARSTPPGGEHDEQVRTWMTQVRLLAQDCHNCIDLYLYSGNPDIHRAKGKLRRYLWWVYWFLRKLLAQHRAAVELRQLKNRARDVGERRLRYGVEVPGKSGSGAPLPTAGLLAAATASSSARTVVASGGDYAAAAAGVDDEDDEDDQVVGATATRGHSHSGRRAFIHPRTLDDYVKAKLSEWVGKNPRDAGKKIPRDAGRSVSMVIMAPCAYQDLLALVQEIWVSKRNQRVVVVDIPAVHIRFMPLQAEDVLFYILRELKPHNQDPVRSSKQKIPQALGLPQPQEQGPVRPSKQKIAPALGASRNPFACFPQPQEQGPVKSRKQKILQDRGARRNLLPYLPHPQEQGPVRSSKQKIPRGAGRSPFIALFRFGSHIPLRYQILNEKKRALSLLKIQENIKEIHEKLDKIKSDIQGRTGNGDRLPNEDKLQGDLDHLGIIDVFLLLDEAIAASQQDQGKNKDIDIPKKLVKKLKGYMEAEKKDKTIEEEEQAKHMGLEEGGETIGQTMEGYMVQGGGEIAEHMVQGEGEVTKPMEEAAAEEQGGGEIANHIEEPGGGEVTKTTQQATAKKKGEEVTKNTEAAAKEGEITEHMEDGKGGGGEEIESQHTTRIHLDEAQYKHILQNLFPKRSSSSSSSSSRPLQAQDRSLVCKQATKNTTATLFGEDEIKQMIHDAKKEILRELQEGKYDKNEGAGESAVPDQNPPVSEKISQMIDNMKQEFEGQLKIKVLVEEIKKHLNNANTLFILKVDELMDVSTLENTRNALSLLNTRSDIMIVTTTKVDIEVAKEYCYPQLEPIDYSLAGLYHDTVIELTSELQKKNEDEYYDHYTQIVHDILDKCEPHEFCMKIFTHALHANPKRSIEEILKLHSILQDLPTSLYSIAKVMFRFSYNDLPKEYKSCLLYLAIFPPGHKIRRSTLIGRWVAEGLTSKENWYSSVRLANRCFDALVDRCLVCPADIGATGNVKSCVVGELIHGIIATIARKQHILETRLSHHLARHFSVFNDLQLRSSDGIDKFFQGLSRSSRVSVLKVLDLEGCKCFTGKNQRYLKDLICRKMLLLKYLSLRKTDITQLPREINNLRELEVLDIRQTEVPPQATANILLLKLKRLLASHVGPKYPSIPHKIYKMVNMEVLANVKAQHSHDLQDIGKLWQLRKLGVVIDDNDNHVKDLLKTVSDLHECLRSLAITIIPATPTPRGSLGITTPSKVKFPCLSATPSPASADESPEDGNGNGIGSPLKNHPKILQSLRIRTTTTHKGSPLSLFIKGNKNLLAKVTLSGTLLSQDDLQALAKLPMLRCVRLQDIACTENMLTFKKKEFICLKYLLIEGKELTNITFEKQSALELEKMVLSFTSTGSISVLGHLPKLQELELNNSFCGRLLHKFSNCTNIAKLTLRGTELEQNDLQILAEKLNIRSLVLLERSFGEGPQDKIVFKKDEFLWLNFLDERSATSKIVFDSESAPRLEKIVWSSSTSLYGIENLPRLKELEFKGGEAVPDRVKAAIDKHQNKPTLKLSGPETQD